MNFYGKILNNLISRIKMQVIMSVLNILIKNKLQKWLGMEE